MSYAPIALFAYDRPDHLERTLNALEKNKLACDSILFVFLDAAKQNASEEQLQRIDSVNDIVQKNFSFKEIHIVKRSCNMGLANSLVDGITQVVKDYGKVIVLEDDILPSYGFLEYMNNALELYENDKQVMQISGYIYPNNMRLQEDTYFLKIMSCWGWATWADRWEYYNHDIEEHYSYFSSKKQIKKFDIEGDAYFYKQLQQNYFGNTYTWAVRWYASWLKNGGYSLYPFKSLIKNIGQDGTGENSVSTNDYFDGVIEFLKIEKKPVKENKALRKSINVFFRDKITRSSKEGFFKNKLTLLKTHLRIQLRNLLFYNNSLLSFNNYFINSKKAEYVNVFSPFEIKDTFIDNYTYISKNSQISNTTIGKFCSIGPNLLCGWGIHPTKSVSTSPSFYSTKKQNGVSFVSNNTFVEKKKIVIGNDVFIGANVTILDGVKIGDGAIIGAGAVVSKDIPPYAIAVGSPIEILKYRFEKEVVNKLMQLKWWDWPIEKLKTITEDFYDIDDFLKKHLTSGNSKNNEKSH